MSSKADILVKTRTGSPLALVEIKNLPRLSVVTAEELRDIVLQELPDAVRYVMIVSQLTGYIWQQQDADRFSGTARYGEPQVLDMSPVFREYYTETELRRQIPGTQLDLVLSHWLGDLARGYTKVLPVTQKSGPLSQFVSDIEGAHVSLEAMA